MCNPRPKNIKLVLFDIGGVVVGSPIAGVHIYEREHGLPFNYLNVAITARGQQGAFQRLERSEIDLWTFYEQFGRELSETKQLNEWYTAFCKSRGLPLPPSLPTKHRVDGRELFGIMMVSEAGAAGVDGGIMADRILRPLVPQRQSTKPDEKVVAAIRKLRGEFVGGRRLRATGTDPALAPVQKPSASRLPR